MCGLALTYPDYAESVQTIIHELSHFETIAATNDNAYGEETCHGLAKQNKANARETADTFGYYALYSNMCFRNAPSSYRVAVPPCRYCSAGTGNRGTNDCSGVSNIVAPAHESQVQTTPDDSCDWPDDGACDEPTYCAYNTDYTDCGTDWYNNPTVEVHTQAPTNVAPPSEAPTTTAPTQQCYDSSLASGASWVDSDGTDDCAKYTSSIITGGTGWCVAYGDSYSNQDLTANQACCGCGGGSSINIAPSEAPTAAAPSEAPSMPPSAPPSQPADNCANAQFQSVGANKIGKNSFKIKVWQWQTLQQCKTKCQADGRCKMMAWKSSKVCNLYSSTATQWGKGWSSYKKKC